MPRPQFSLKTMLWLMALVGAFFAGMKADRELLKRRGATIIVEDPDNPGAWMDMKDP